MNALLDLARLPGTNQFSSSWAGPYAINLDPCSEYAALEVFNAAIGFTTTTNSTTSVLMRHSLISSLKISPSILPSPSYSSSASIPSVLPDPTSAASSSSPPESSLTPQMSSPSSPRKATRNTSIIIGTTIPAVIVFALIVIIFRRRRLRTKATISSYARESIQSEGTRSCHTYSVEPFDSHTPLTPTPLLSHHIDKARHEINSTQSPVGHICPDARLSVQPYQQSAPEEATVSNPQLSLAQGEVRGNRQTVFDPAYATSNPLLVHALSQVIAILQPENRGDNLGEAPPSYIREGANLPA